MSDLARLPCIIDTNGKSHSNWRFVDEKGAGFSVPVGGHIEVNSPTAAVRAAASGLGVAQVPAFIARSCLESGRIVSILEDYLPTDRGIYAIYPHRHHLSAKVRIFIDLAAAHRAVLLSKDKAVICMRKRLANLGADVATEVVLGVDVVCA